MLDCKQPEPAGEKAADQKHSPQKKHRWYKTCTAIKKTQLMRFVRHSISHGQRSTATLRQNNDGALLVLSLLYLFAGIVKNT
jgi:hypothetical protein